MPFRIGERVKFLNEKGGGEIVKIISDEEVEVLSDDGFTYDIHVSELVGMEKNLVNNKLIKEKLDKINSTAINHHIHQNNTKKHILPNYLMNSKKNWTSKDKDFVEIDLHIEELVDKPRFLSDGEKLNYQLTHARMCLDEAYEFKIKRVIFIHGVGAGVLRSELRKWLETLGSVEIQNADFRRYGMGATEVWIKN